MRNISDWPFPPSASRAVEAAIPKAVEAAITVVKYAGMALGAYLLYNLVTKGVTGGAAAITRDVVGGVVDAGAGVVVGAGEVVGLPATDQDRCIDAIYAGRTWDASFACPAATFIRYLGGVKPPRPGDDGLSGPRRMKRRDRRMTINRNC